MRDPQGPPRPLPAPVPVSGPRDESAAWETLWRWKWFARDTWRADFRLEVTDWCLAVGSVLARFGPRTVHDWGCGLGFKTLMLAEKGYVLSGSDACQLAIEAARELAAEERLDIPFLHTEIAGLPRVGGQRYDCLHSDHFDALLTRAELAEAAAGAFAALTDRGVFVFGAAPNRTREELDQAIDLELTRMPRFVVFPACAREGIRVRELHFHRRSPQGIVQERLYLVEEGAGAERVETTHYLFPALWTRADFREVCAQAGFKDLLTFEEPVPGKDPIIFHVALK